MKSTRIITIHYEKSEDVLTLGYAPVSATWVSCQTLFQEFPAGCLIERKHKFLQTQIILDNTPDCLLIVFDVGKEFVTVKPHKNLGDAPMSFLTSDHYVVLLPANTALTTKDIRSIEINKSPKD